MIDLPEHTIFETPALSLSEHHFTLNLPKEALSYEEALALYALHNNGNSMSATLLLCTLVLIRLSFTPLQREKREYQIEVLRDYKEPYLPVEEPVPDMSFLPYR